MTACISGLEHCRKVTDRIPERGKLNVPKRHVRRYEPDCEPEFLKLSLAQPVPVPTSALLFTSSLVAMASLKRRKQV